MRELPKIISVDDHVVEPPHVWQTWLPGEVPGARARASSARSGASSSSTPGARYEMNEDPEGLWGDAWYYEDRLIYVHKRFVAIPLEATPGGDVSSSTASKMLMTAVTYDEMRPGCYDRDARIKDFELNWIDGSLPFPTFPRFCGQTFYEGDDKDLGLACVKAYNDWMVEEWCEPSGGLNIPLCLIPLWDVELAAAETQRNADRGVRAICFSELPHHLKLPTIHTGDWDPLFQVCNDTGVTLCMHIGSSSTNPAASPDAPGGVGGTLAFNNSMASLADWLFSGQAHPVPEAEARVLRGPDRLDPLRARAGRHGVGAARQLAAVEGEDPRAAVDLLLRPDLRLLHRRPPRAALARRSRRGQHLLRDRLPAHRHDVAELEGVRREDARRLRRRHRLQGAAGQRDQDAGARPRLIFADWFSLRRRPDGCAPTS